MATSCGGALNVLFGDPAFALAPDPCNSNGAGGPCNGAGPCGPGDLFGGGDENFGAGRGWGCGGAGLSRNDGGLRVLGRPCGCVSGLYDGGGGVLTLVPCACWRLFAFAGGCLCGGWLFGGGGCDGGGGGGGGGGAGACCGSGGGSPLWKWWPWYITS